MPVLTFGINDQVQFDNDAEFYQALGFLSKNDGTTSIHWEHNEQQGAWGSEGRIHCYQNIARFPDYFSNAFTAGVGRIVHRINCNGYIEYLVNNHSVMMGNTQNAVAVRATVPPANHPDFDGGLVL